MPVLPIVAPSKTREPPGHELERQRHMLGVVVVGDSLLKQETEQRIC